MFNFVLVSSPLTGPMTWLVVADELREQGHSAVIPTLPRPDRTKPPYWRAMAAAVVESQSELPPNAGVILVGHSGAGPRLPWFTGSGQDALAYLFVDAALPGMPPDKDWLRSIEEQSDRGWVPTWPEEALFDEIPSPVQRAAFMAELPPRWPLALFLEETPVPDGWPSAPCGYLSLTDRYPESVARAEELGWPIVELSGSHFEMLNDAPAVIGALLDLLVQLGVS